MATSQNRKQDEGSSEVAQTSLNNAPQEDMKTYLTVPVITESIIKLVSPLLDDVPSQSQPLMAAGLDSLGRLLNARFFMQARALYVINIQ